MTATVTLSNLPWLPEDAAVPTLTLSHTFFHQGPVGFPVDSCADPASNAARYQRRGGPGVWYGSSRSQGAWAEMLRHWSSVGLSPFEVRRRVGQVTVRATVIDLTNPMVAALLGLKDTDLTGDDYSRCQHIAEAAYHAGVHGLLSPSAAMPGCTTVAIFARDRAAAVTARHWSIQHPPTSMLRHIGIIRLVGPDAREVDALLRWALHQHRLRQQVLRRRRQHRIQPKRRR